MFHSNLVATVKIYKTPRVEENEFMHFLSFPACGRGVSIIRDQLPLRDAPVRFTPGTRRRPHAIGIELVEKLSALWVMGYCIAAFIAISLFASIWWLLKGDMQGAFGAAGFFASSLGILAIGVTIAVSSMT